MSGGLRQVTAAATAAALWFAMCAAYCAFADTPRAHERVVFAYVDDVMVQTLDNGLKAEIGKETQRELMLEVTVEQDGVLPDIEAELVDVADYDPYVGPAEVHGNPDGLNSQVGVVEHDGHIETAYSSNVAYHVDTPDWTPDGQGFYRTDDGYYVVASSDYEHGTVIETSQGKAIVLDDGCSSGVVDFYTNW